MQNKIIETTDYSLFKKHPHNVPIDFNHVNKIVESLKTNNGLAYNPILVDAEYRVIDGQHRLEAAKKLQLPIFYVKDDNASSSLMQAMNTAARTWTHDLWVEHYAAVGVEGYPELLAFLKKHNISFNKGIAVLGCNINDVNARNIRGELVIPEERYDFAEETMMFHQQVYDLLLSRFGWDRCKFMKTNGFMRCFFKFMLYHDIDKERFMRILSGRASLLYPCINSPEYYESFINLYNYHQPTSKRLRLSYELAPKRPTIEEVD